MRKLAPDKREKFLNTALKLFVANGVQNTSTAAIAKESGTAAGTLFLYFPTKQDLIHELVLKISREQSEYIKTLLEPSLSVRDTFFTIWSGSIRWFLENMAAYEYNLQVRELVVEEAIVQESAKSLAYFYEAIQKGLNEGALKPYPVEMIGGILYQDIVAMMDLLRTQSDPEKQEETIQLGFDIFWDGIRIADASPAAPTRVIRKKKP
ncbi:MAG: TetR/AcrR family transcriptional regulator [Chloroflexi bacterium]|nr:MAG: TetR/AcrR family transcriptional regulator [Chloroflexota bacterium]